MKEQKTDSYVCARSQVERVRKLYAQIGEPLPAEIVLFQGLPPVRANFQWLGAALFAAAFVILRKLRWSPILVMLLCGAAGLCIGFLETLP